MRNNRKILILTLMSSSILLLLILQFLWIRSEYKAAEDAFRKETNLVFRHTVAELIDSLFMTRVELHRKNDSTVLVKRTRFPKRGINSDNAIRALRDVLKSDGKEPLILSEDTNYFGNVTRSKHQTLMIRINPDSLDVGSISHKYRLQLREIDRNVGFKVVKKDGGKVVNFDTAFMTDFIKIGPGSRLQYAASFNGVKLSLIKEIYPQILFSILLTLLIIIAFIVLFRNLRLQQRLITQKDDFINNVSHELKTPVATVNVALEAFKNFKVLDNPQLTDEYLDIVRRELDRLSLMTDRILNAAVYANKGIEVTTEQLNLEELVIQILTGMKAVWDKEHIAVAIESSGSDFKLTGSREHLTNVIHNLLDNAVKYSQKPVQVSVSLREDNKNVILTVADSGMGIPEVYHKKIFEKFFRVPLGDIHNVRGYGLGLSYVAQVISAHKGTIDVESVPGKGTTFTIQLPKNGGN